MPDAPRLSFPTHRFVKRGNQLIEEPFQLVAPHGRLPLCLSVTLDGTRIAWEFCAGCGLHVARCIHDIPIEPPYITRMRTGAMPELSYTSQTAVHRSEASKDRYQFSGSGGSAKISISDLVTADVVATVKAAKEARDGNA